MAVTINGNTGISLVQDGVVTLNTLAANSVNSSKIVDASVTNTDLATPVNAIQTCKAWCNFDGTLTGTNAPRAGYNVTSITRTAAGTYTVNFTSSLTDANYAATYGGGATTSNCGRLWVSSTAAAHSFKTINPSTGVANDDAQVYVTFFGN